MGRNRSAADSAGGGVRQGEPDASCGHEPTEADRALELGISALLDGRAASSTICPSEVARAAAEDWRPLMEPVRRAARRMVAAGEVEILQGGRVVDPATVRGPIRIRRAR